MKYKFQSLPFIAQWTIFMVAMVPVGIFDRIVHQQEDIFRLNFEFFVWIWVLPVALFYVGKLAYLAIRFLKRRADRRQAARKAWRRFFGR